MNILQITVGIFCVVSFTLLILLVLVWWKRRDRRNSLLQYIKEYTEKRVVGYLLNIPNELKKLKKSSFEKNFEELFWPLAIVFYNSLLFLLLNKTLFIFWSASSLLILVFFAILMWALAINDYFVTLMSAMQAKAIMCNEAFYRMIMSYTNKIFSFEDPINYYSQEIENEQIIEGGKKKLWQKQKIRLGEIAFARKQLGLKGVKEINDPYDIVPDIRDEEIKSKNIFLPKFLRNIPWVGILPFYKIYSYRFRWASFEQKHDSVTGALVTRPVIIEKALRYITLKDDVYNMTVESAETQEAIPLNVEIAITANIINPRKALFQIEKWLEVIINQVGAKIRKFIGTQGYFELIQAKEEEKDLLDLRGEKLLSDKNLEFIISSIRLIYGVNIKRVQIKELNPATKEAEQFIKASIQEFISARQSAGWKKEAEGLEKKFNAISKIPGGKEMYIAEQYGGSDISALSFGGGGHYPTFPIPEEKSEEKKKGGEK